MTGAIRDGFRFVVIVGIIASGVWTAASIDARVKQVYDQLETHEAVRAMPVDHDRMNRFPDDTRVTNPEPVTGRPAPVIDDPEPEREPEPVLSVDHDPCPGLDGRDRVRCWLENAYDLFGIDGRDDIDVALAVAGQESGFRPLACNGDNGVSGPRGSCRPTGASGVFQHMPAFWDGRASTALRTIGVDDGTLDIWNGWHNTIVSVRLAGGSSWKRHWAACSDSVFNQGGTVRCGTAGGQFG